MATTRSPRQMKRLSLLVLCLGASAFLASRPALADLVVFDDGRVVKAASYKVVDEILEACNQSDPFLPRLAQNYDLSFREDRKPLFNTAYDQIIAAEARRYGVDASMVSALIRAES